MWAGDPNNLKTGVGGWGGENFRHGSPSRACARDPSFPSKTPVSLMALAVAPGGSRSKGLAGKANS